MAQHSQILLQLQQRLAVNQSCRGSPAKGGMLASQAPLTAALFLRDLDASSHGAMRHQLWHADVFANWTDAAYMLAIASGFVEQQQ